jgi:hypothetical protein
MPSLFRLLFVLGVIGGVIAGGLYALAVHFQPEPKEISKGLRNIKARPAEETSSTTPSTTAPAPVPADAATDGANTTP